MDSSIAIDLGGTNLRCGVVTPDGALTNVERCRLRPHGKATSRDFWTDFIAISETYASHRPGREPIALSLPGPVSDGLLTAAPTVLTRAGQIPDLRAVLSERTGRQVFALNDVSAAAWHFADRLTATRFLVVTISSGIGAKLFDVANPRGTLDDRPFAGEIGHLLVSAARGEPCDCGGSGHLGAIASGRGIERLARRRAVEDAEGFARSLCATQFAATAGNLENERHFVPAARAGDRWALQLLREASVPLAEVLRTIVIGAGVERVALMGGFAQALGSCYLSVLRDTFEAAQDVGPAAVPACRLFLLAGPTEDPSLRGAGLFAQRMASHVAASTSSA